MKKTFALAIILMLAMFSVTPSLMATALGEERVSVIVMFKERPQPDLIQNLGGEVNTVYRFQPAVAAVIPMRALEILNRNPMVEYAVLDLPIELVGQTMPWGVERIGAPIVHAAGNKGNGINVAVLDTGIDTDHPDLSYVDGYDFAHDDSDPQDFDGHGTHVAGTVAALDNDIGVIGVAPEADLYILKIFTDDGSGTYSVAVKALEWCIGTYSDGVSGNEIKVISMSWGSKASSGDPGIESWINQAYDLGILLVGAAGNEGNPRGTGDNVIYPARYENVIAVAATDSTDTRAWWSSTGPAVELAAPGVSILSTYLDAGYTTLSGTSMACPHVSGVAALIWYKDSSLTNKDVRSILQNTATDLGDEGRDTKYGYGLVNAEKACGEQAPPPEEGKMHVGDISMWYVKRGPWYTVYTKVSILDANNQAVSGATVYVDTALPDGSIQKFSGTTGSDGTVTFSLKSKLTGTYTSTVTNVVKDGMTYDSASNVETSESLTVP